MNANTLEATVSDIVARLRQGRYPNEQSISQGIVLRLLHDLGGDTEAAKLSPTRRHDDVFAANPKHYLSRNLIVSGEAIEKQLC